MSTHDDRAQLLDQLSAYLDGELDAAGRRQMEDRLAIDAAARDELRRLQRAWDLLDGLPRAEVEPSFTRSTVEMIAVEAGGADEATGSRSSGAWPRRGAWALAYLLLAAGGYFTLGSVYPDANRRLVEQLPMLEHLDAMRQAGSFEFLVQLHAAGLLKPQGNEPAPAAGPSGRSKIEAMNPAEKDALVRAQERYEELDPDERQRLQRFARELADSPQSAELTATLERYHRWLGRLSDFERAELVQLAPQRRVERIAQLQAAHPMGQPLSVADMQALVRWLEQRVLQNVTPAERERLKKMTPTERHRQAMRLLVERSQMMDLSRWFTAPRPGGMEELRGMLSESARQQLAAALAAHEVGPLLGEWIRQTVAVQLGMRGGSGTMSGPTQEQLKQFFEHELSAAQRQQLLMLPADELVRRVRRLYFIDRHGPDAGFMRPPGEPGRRPAPPPPFEPRPRDKPGGDDRPPPRARQVLEPRGDGGR